MSKTSPAGPCPAHGALVRLLNDGLEPAEARRVESHVEGCARCQRSLEALTPSTLVASARSYAATTFAPAEDFLAALRAEVSAEVEDGGDDPDPPSVPGYEVIRQLGRGGMGVVYLARDERLKRLVALKLLHGVAGGESLRLRLRREAGAVARLQHPNAIQIYEIGEAAGRPFLALEFVDGPSLDRAFADGPAPPRRAAELVERLARAMHAAHQAGIVHRDLKPANVLLTPDGTPKITDFGLAKLLGEEADGATRSGQLLGTPSYAAPEQVAALGDGASEVGPAADIYSLGAILYELLTGRPPFRAGQPIETLLQVLHKDPAPPSAINSRVPRDLETICLFCLNKSAARRYPSAEALANDLRCYLDGRPVKARPVRFVGRTVRWSRRHPAAAALVAVVFGSLLGGALALAWLWQEAELRALAQADARGAAEQTARAETGARAAAERQARAETDARRAADRRTAEIQVDHAISLCAQGSVGPGLLGLAEAASTLPPDAEAARVARANIAAWKPYAARHCCDLGHPDEITGVAFNPDGRVVATACKDGIVRLWDSPTGVRTKPELRHPGAVTAVGFRADAGAVVTACKDGAARLWAYPSGEPIGEPMRHDGELTLLAIDPTGKFLATGGGGNVRIWDAGTAELHRGPLAQGGAVRSLAFSQDGSLLAAGSADGGTRFWKAATGDISATWRQHRAPITSVAFGPKGVAAAGSSLGMMAQFAVPGTDPPRPASFSNESPTSALAFDPRGRYLAVAVGDAEYLPRVDLYRVEGVKVSAHPLASDAPVRALTVSADGRNLLVTAADRPPVLWAELEDRPTRVTFGESADGPAAFSPNGRTVATSRRERGGAGWVASLWEVPASADGGVTLSQAGVTFISVGPADHALLAGSRGAQLWHLPSAKPSAAKWTAPAPVTACSWGDRPTAWAVDGAKVHSLDARTGEPVRESLEFPAAVSAFAAARDGRTVGAVAGAEARLVEVETGKWRALGAAGEPPDALTFSPDGGLLAAGGADGTVRLWSVPDALAVGEPLVCRAGVRRLAFDASGTRLAVACDDNSAVVWDLANRKVLGSPMVHPTAVAEMGWSPEGSLLVTTHGRGTARFWDAATGKQIGPALPRGVSTAAFTSAGKLLLTGHRTQVVRSWRVPQPVATSASELPTQIREELGIRPGP